MTRRQQTIHDALTYRLLEAQALPDVLERAAHKVLAEGPPQARPTAHKALRLARAFRAALACEEATR